MKKIWQPRKFPRKCKEFSITPCWICTDWNHLKMDCAIIHYKKGLEQTNDVKQYILAFFQSAAKPHGPKKGHIYLEAAIRIYFPEHIESYKKLAILL